MENRIYFSKSFIDFLIKYRYENKVCKVLAKVRYMQSNYDREYKNIITTKAINYITFRNDGNISFLPAGKQCNINRSGNWDREGRQDGSAVRVIRKLFTGKAIKRLFRDTDFELFANKYKSEFSGEDYTFELLENKRIPDVYCMPIKEGGGSLNQSCMNGDRDYLELYKACPNVKILILKSREGLLCGRALIWQVGETVFMDRIYVVADFMVTRFLKYAEDNGWWRKDRWGSYDYKTVWISPAGRRFENKVLTIQTPTDFKFYPYLDTFTFGGDGFITNSNNGDDREIDYEYNCTDGTRFGEVLDALTNRKIKKRYAAEISYGAYGGCFIHKDSMVLDNNGYRVWKDDERLIVISGTYYDKEGDSIVKIGKNYHLRSDCVFIDNKGKYYLKKQCVQIKKKWYVKDEVFITNYGNCYTEDMLDAIVMHKGEELIEPYIFNPAQMQLFTAA